MLSIWMMSPGCTDWRHVAGVAEQRLAMSQRADDDVALADLGHAAAGQLERVVGRLVGQHLDHDDDAFLGGNVRGDAHFMRQSAGLRDRGNLVDDDTSHPASHPLAMFKRPCARSAARRETRP